MEIKEIAKQLLKESFRKIESEEELKEKFALCCKIIEGLIQQKEFELAEKLCKKAKQLCFDKGYWDRLFNLSVSIFKAKAEEVFSQAEISYNKGDFEASFKQFLSCLRIFPEPKVLIYLHLICGGNELAGKDSTQKRKKIRGTLVKYRQFSFFVENSSLSKEWRLKILASVHAIAGKFKDREYQEEIEKFVRKNHKEYCKKLERQRNNQNYNGTEVWTYLGSLAPVDSVASRVSGFKYRR